MPRARTLARLALLPCLVAMSPGCGLVEAFARPDLEPVAAVLRTAGPTAYVASAAMRAVAGDAIDGVAASRTCSDYPCVAGVAVELDDDVLPIRTPGPGRALVAGRWRSPDDATLTVRIVGTPVGTRRYPARAITIVRVGRDDDRVEVVIPAFGVHYGLDPGYEVVGPDPFGFVVGMIEVMDAHPRDVHAGFDMSVWKVEIDEAGTPSDLADDDYWLNSVGQAASLSFDGTHFHQLVLHDVLLGPECTLNPIEGDAYLLDVGTGLELGVIPRIDAAGQAAIGFEPECDGKLRLEFGTGTYMFRSFQKLAIEI